MQIVITRIFVPSLTLTQILHIIIIVARYKVKTNRLSLSIKLQLVALGVARLYQKRDLRPKIRRNPNVHKFWCPGPLS